MTSTSCSHVFCLYSMSKVLFSSSCCPFVLRDHQNGHHEKCPVEATNKKCSFRPAVTKSHTSSPYSFLCLRLPEIEMIRISFSCFWSILFSSGRLLMIWKTLLTSFDLIIICDLEFCSVCQMKSALTFFEFSGKRQKSESDFGQKEGKRQLI